jgi:uncharacterized cofD-like protein
MVRSYRLRRVIGPTRSLLRAAGLLILGILILAVGIGLVFRSLLAPFLVWLSHVTTIAISHVVKREDVDETKWIIGGLMLIGGFYVVVQGARFALRHILGTLDPGLKMGKMGDAYFKKQQLSQGPRVVAIGGGTGLSTLLRGLKSHTSNITAIVTVTDDGGSSGKLIRDKGMIPPGDIRNCLVALADAEKSMTDLFQHRFKNDSGSLSGHSMGNLLIAALVDQAHGDFEKAIEIASDVLAIRGRVVPSTLSHVHLRAELEDGSEVSGETAIVAQGKRIKRIYLQPEECDPTREALEAIRTADLIVIGPGSVYTSVIPNLLVRGIAEALRETKALRIYICNVMTQPGESDSFTASEHVNAILNNVDGRAFDYVLVNKALPTAESLTKYAEVGQQFVEPDIDRIRAMGIRPVASDLMSETDVVRHDPVKLAARLMSLLR